MKLTTTLKRLRRAYACKDSYTSLRMALGPRYGDNNPISLLTILEHNGLRDAIWALRATVVPCNVIARLMAADFADDVLPIWKSEHPDDNRPALCIKAARDFAEGLITAEQLQDARSASWSASWSSSWSAAWDIALETAWDAGLDAAWDAAWAAVWDGFRAEVSNAAQGAAWVAASEATIERQKSIFLRYVTED